MRQSARDRVSGVRLPLPARGPVASAFAGATRIHPQVYTAVKASVPIVAVCVRGKNYDFDATLKQLTHLDTELDILNPVQPCLS